LLGKVLAGYGKGESPRQKADVCTSTLTSSEYLYNKQTKVGVVWVISFDGRTHSPAARGCCDGCAAAGAVVAEACPDAAKGAAVRWLGAWASEGSTAGECEMGRLVLRPCELLPAEARAREKQLEKVISYDWQSEGQNVQRLRGRWCPSR